MKGQIGSSKEVVIEADCAQFAQMIITAENRTLKLSNVLNHPLGPCPWALDSADAGIAEENQQIITYQGASQKNMTAADMIPQPCGRIFDGMVMVQKIRGDQKTFAELALQMTLNAPICAAFVTATIGALSSDDGDARDDVQQKIFLYFTFEFRSSIDLFGAPICPRTYPS